MAINPSNSNAINITSLPQAQLAVPGDFLLLQTPNGTQVIDFNNLNTVKTDIFGNATITGDITGNNALFANVQVLDLSARHYFTSIGQGTDASNDFYDRFTIQDGIVLSASSNTFSNPVYTQITTTNLPAATSYMLTLFRRVSDEQGVATILAGNTRATVNITNFFITYPYLDITTFTTNYSNFILTPITPNVDISSQSIAALANVATAIAGVSGRGAMPTVQSALTGLIFSIPSLSSTPICPAIVNGSIQATDNGNSLQFAIGLPYPLIVDMPVYYRVLTTTNSLN